MKRKTLEGPAYETDTGKVLAHGPLYIMLEDFKDYPRAMHHTEGFDGFGTDYVDIEPTTTARLEVVEFKNSLYYPTSFDSLDDALQSGQTSRPTKFATEDRVITIRETGIPAVDCTELVDGEVNLRRQDETQLVVDIGHLEKTAVLNRAAFADAVASGDIQTLIPLEITERAYHL